MAYSLVGVDGNAWSIMGYVVSAMKDALKEAKDQNDTKGIKDFDSNAQKAYQSEAMSSNYDHLVCTSSDMIMKVNEYLGDDDEFIDEEDI